MFLVVYCCMFIDAAVPLVNLPLSQILPPVVSLLPPGLPLRTFARTISSELLGF